ncbi:MAG: VOC family virulence protein [Gammaproteobacteria bacterium]|nr:VOC family virulence protein [Gammaproteobacteria bacterium]MYB36133.1 VOC family virulence protein [Gammaproteobacteria bacterium]
MIAGLDHVAIPIANVEEMLAFYEALGFVVRRGERLHSIHFGNNRLNFHAPALWNDERFTLRGPTARPGCGDFCFVWQGTVESIARHLGKLKIEIIEGPAPREGGRNGGKVTGTSVYVRDPDGNLLEFMTYGETSPCTSECDAGGSSTTGRQGWAGGGVGRERMRRAAPALGRTP